MKLKRLKVEGYRNIHACDMEWSQPFLLNTVIGSNGSGKSNLIEVLLHILLDVYTQKPPSFDFTLEYEAQGRSVRLEGLKRHLTIEVDGEPISLSRFAERLRGGPAQVYYPELTFVYYSGECPRVKKLVRRYVRHFNQLTRSPDTDSFRPLFVHSENEQANVILLALCAHRKQQLIDRLAVRNVGDVILVLQSPDGFDPDEHEPKLWNTVGATRRIVAAIDDTAEQVEGLRRASTPISEDFESSELEMRDTRRPREKRVYLLRREDDPHRGLHALARRLEASGDNLYLAFEHLRSRGIFVSVKFDLVGARSVGTFPFTQLSEGEKQLLAVIGALSMAHRNDNLILLDEPDTHLNPQWSWEYTDMLVEAFGAAQTNKTNVIMSTHDPVMISGLARDQVWLARAPDGNARMFDHPKRNPRGQGVANLLCSSEFFGLPSSLDKQTQRLMDERLRISVQPQLSDADRTRLRELNQELEIITPGVSDRDPEYVAFLRQKYRKEG